jgi:hypothetical protein
MAVCLFPNNAEHSDPKPIETLTEVQLAESTRKYIGGRAMNDINQTFKELIEKTKARLISGNQHNADCPCCSGKDKLYLNLVGQKILIYCHRNCPFTDIVNALGYQQRDFFEHHQHDNSSESRTVQEDFSSNVNADNGIERADPDTLHAVNSKVMAYAYQSGEHKKNLNQRGFPSEHQDEYFTLNQETISNINDRIQKDFSEEVLLKVPGFFKDNNGEVKFSARWGMAIPVRDYRGRIVALKSRSDKLVEKNKYIIVSSNSKGGASPGSPIHHPLFKGSKDAIETIIVTEGELKANFIYIRTGIYSLSIPGCAQYKKIITELAYYKNLRKVIIAYDADKNTNYAVSDSLFGFLKFIHEQRPDLDVSIYDWDIEDGKGLDDLLVNGKQPREIIGKANAKSHVKQCRDHALATDPKAAVERNPSKTEGSSEPPPFEVCLNLITPKIIDKFHDSNEEPFITIKRNNHHETYPVRSSKLRMWLQSEYFSQEAKPLSTGIADQVIETLQHQSIFEGLKREVYLRVGKYNNSIIYDLANENWEYVEITREGWTIINESPVPFIRPKGIAAAGTPAKTTQNLVSLLSKYIHPVKEHGILLIAGWLIACMNPSSPKPVLCLSGEQGSAKSTTTRMLKKIADNSSVPLKSLPRNEQDLSIIAKNSWIPAFDNISSLTSWLSDAMSKMSTGGGYSTRSLYTNDEESLWTFTRAIILNGINEIPKKSDLLERSICIQLKAIPEDERKTEKEIWNQFDTDLPFIMGALFDCVACAIRRYKDVNLRNLPRMADFITWVTAAEPALGIPDGTFVEIFNAGQIESIELNIEGNPFASAILEFLERQWAERWEGRAGELMDELEKFVSDKTIRSNRWPNTPRGAADALKNITPMMRKIGIHIKSTGNTRTRTWLIEKVEKRSDSESITNLRELGLIPADSGTNGKERVKI